MFSSMDFGNFNEITWDADSATDKLVHGLFGKIKLKDKKRRKSKNKDSQSADQMSSKTSQNSSEQPKSPKKVKKRKIDETINTTNTNTVSSTTSQLPGNKKTRKNKYYHLALAARALRENSGDVQTTCSEKKSKPSEKKKDTEISQTPTKKPKLMQEHSQKNLGKQAHPKSKQAQAVTVTEKKKGGRNKYKHLAEAAKTKRENNPTQNEHGEEGKHLGFVSHSPAKSKTNSNIGSDSKATTNELSPGRKKKEKNKHKKLAKSSTDSGEYDVNKTRNLSESVSSSKAATKRTLSEDVPHKSKKSKIKEAAMLDKSQTKKLKAGTKHKKASDNTKKIAGDSDSTADSSSEDIPENVPTLPKKSPFNVSKLKGVLDTSQTSPTVTAQKKHAPQGLKERMMDQLKAARFRYLNEQLYTVSGSQASELFSEDQGAFEVYHEGFQGQVSKWPENPLDKMVKFIKTRPASNIVADFGCGDAKLALQVPQKVHSFDLVALNSRVTPCDMAHVPLSPGSVDIGVFCLSLMGTNLIEYITEAHRVLKKGACLLVAEVVSRFDNVVSFVRKMEKLGFILLKKDEKNKMFVWFEFKKAGKVDRGLVPDLELQPCVYKKR